MDVTQPENQGPAKILLSDMHDTLVGKMDGQFNQELADAYGALKEKYNIKIHLVTLFDSVDFADKRRRMELIENVLKPAHLEREVILCDGIFRVNDDGLEKIASLRFARDVPPTYKNLAEQYFHTNATNIVLVDDDVTNRMMAKIAQSTAIEPDANSVLRYFEENMGNPGLHLPRDDAKPLYGT